MILACPGPSLAEAGIARGDADRIVAVNRAVHAVPADVWVFEDAHQWLDYRPEHRAVIYTTYESHRQMNRKTCDASMDQWDVRLLDEIGCTVRMWNHYSATAALGVCWWLGATRIDVYGADMAGTLDWDGYSDEHDKRDEARWLKEWRIWVWVMDWLSEQGVAVERK